ncbi:MAG TPA: hypothetical protein VLD63_04920 [Anaerolineales bacterium]|nr:hypothetical protein [Anaerolineales bacterium]
MNHLVRLEAEAGELESILRGVKTMLAREPDPAQPISHPVSPGDSLYFLRDTDDGVVRVRATVTRVLIQTSSNSEDLSHTLKEMQPRLQLTEGQYNHWAAGRQVLLVEFENARKMNVIHVAPNRITESSGWIAFGELREITE